MPPFDIGQEVRDLAGMKGKVIGILGSRARVQWAEHATWIEMTRLQSCKE